jgi:hypothetical protein
MSNTQNMILRGSKTTFESTRTLCRARAGFESESPVPSSHDFHSLPQFVLWRDLVRRTMMVTDLEPHHTTACTRCCLGMTSVRMMSANGVRDRRKTKSCWPFATWSAAKSARRFSNTSFIHACFRLLYGDFH